MFSRVHIGFSFHLLYLASLSGLTYNDEIFPPILFSWRSISLAQRPVYSTVYLATSPRSPRVTSNSMYSNSPPQSHNRVYCLLSYLPHCVLFPPIHCCKLLNLRIILLFFLITLHIKTADTTSSLILTHLLLLEYPLTAATMPTS